MSTRRKIIPGETIPLEIFAEVIKERARKLSDRALELEGIRPPKMDEIIEASNEDLRTEQLGDMFTYADLDRIFQPENI